jgi:hypothetical protein
MLDVLVQLADPVRDMVKEVSVPFAGLNCAADVPAKKLLLVDIVAAGLIVIVKFSVMVSALAAGARTAAPTAAAINPDLTVRMGLSPLSDFSHGDVCRSHAFLNSVASTKYQMTANSRNQIETRAE